MTEHSTTEPQFVWSFTRDGHFTGPFNTIDEAIEDVRLSTASFECQPDYVYVGECVPPRQPETYWEASDWLEHVGCSDEYLDEASDDWDRSTAEQRDELEQEVKKVLAAWLDRHKLRPAFFMVENIQSVEVQS